MKFRLLLALTALAPVFAKADVVLLQDTFETDPTARWTKTSVPAGSQTNRNQFFFEGGGVSTGQEGSNHAGLNFTDGTAIGNYTILFNSTVTASAGQQYYLAGLVGDRTSLAWETITFSLISNGSAVQSVSFTPSTVTNNAFDAFTTGNFTASGGETLAMQVNATRTANSGGTQQVNFDNLRLVQVQAIPEPSTYGLLGAGALAAVAAVRRRRKA